MRPERYARSPERFEAIRANLNKALAFVGLAVEETGELVAVERLNALSEAHRRAAELRADLVARDVHSDVIAFCSEDLVADNYFHTVLEATKSVANKLRTRTGLAEDGASLVDKALGGATPIMAINALTSESEWSEQRGFANLVKGIFGMFRNPAAHEARLLWPWTRATPRTCSRWSLLCIAGLIGRGQWRRHKG